MSDKNPGLDSLKRVAAQLRYDVVKMVGPNNPGHFGGSFSITEVVTALYFYKMRHDPQNPKWSQRDRLVFSKGHAGIIQYAALAESGYFPRETLWTLKRLGSSLQGHPDVNKTPGIEANTGSLGQGLSIACGMAAADRLDGKDSRVYCIVGDGECAEGQIWEASMCAVNHRLDHLVAILDLNGYSAMGAVPERYNTGPHEKKWAAQGWNVLTCDGHNMEEIMACLDEADTSVGKPTMILAKTVKGKGLPFGENTHAFHNGSLTEEQYAGMLTLLKEQGARD